MALKGRPARRSSTPGLLSFSLIALAVGVLAADPAPPTAVPAPPESAAAAPVAPKPPAPEPEKPAAPAPAKPASSAPKPAAAKPARAALPSNDDCLTCHGGDETLSMERGGKKISLYLKPEVLQGSVHAKVACVGCHEGFNPEETPHKAKITPVNCVSCHANAASKHVFHAAMVAARMKQGPPSAACKGCHGTHDVRRMWVRGGTAGPADVNAACAQCHAQEVAHYQQSAHGRAAAAGQPGAPQCITCHQKPVTPAATGGQETAALKIEQEKLCLSCHLDDARVRARVAPGAGFIAAYETSVHGAALRAGDAKAATCVDCHGSHEMAKGLDPRSRANKAHIPGTCGRCHDAIAKEYAGSVHGVAVAKGSEDAPVCTDCHGEHTIRKARSPESPVAPANVSEKVCSPCHSSVRMAAKYGLRSDRFQTYSDSFHGLAIRGGLVSAANCASCHGSHNIRPSTDPQSTIYPANLARTCGKCHPGATAAFAIGKVHLEMTEKDEPLLYWIGLIYTILIVGTIGGMFFHNLLDFYRKGKHRLRVRRGRVAGEEPIGHGLYVRMTLAERLQHGSLLLSFTVLVLTGFALRYPDSWAVDQLKRLSTSLFEWRAIAHRVAGVVMVAAALFHIWYLTLTARGRQFFRDIMFGPGDLKDLSGAFRFYFGLTHERPQFGRFSYVEKSEYWALVWGTVVMAGTGVIMWFQNPFIALLSKLGWDVARTIHVYEAVLATLAIIVWHLYFVIFNPDVYPMNVAWLTGTISEAEMEEEHPLELEALRRRKAEEEARRQLGGKGTTPEGGTT